MNSLTNSPTVSVIIPTYNYGKFIEKAINSVFAQTYPVQEIIVVDDGSSDNTEEIINKFGKKINYIKQNNNGVSSARNKGVQNANGDFIAFLDADDWWLPEKIEKQIAKFSEDDSLGLVHCGMREFDSATGETIRLYIEGKEGWVADDLLLFEEPVISGCGGTIMISRKVFDDVGGFDTRLKIGEDWEFCYRIARKYQVGFIAEPLINYRNHGINSHLNIKEMERSNLLAWNKVFNTKDEKVLRLKRKSFGNLHKVIAGSYFQSEHYLDFFIHLLKSIWYKPEFFKFYLSIIFRRQRRS